MNKDFISKVERLEDITIFSKEILKFVQGYREDKCLDNEDIFKSLILLLSSISIGSEVSLSELILDISLCYNILCDKIKHIQDNES
jgi:hypothetical protein